MTKEEAILKIKREIALARQSRDELKNTLSLSAHTHNLHLTGKVEGLTVALAILAQLED